MKNLYTKLIQVNGNNYIIDIYDLPGDCIKSNSKTYSFGANGIIYCCQVKNEQSRSELSSWKKDLKIDGNIPKICIENKCDLLHEEKNYNIGIDSLKTISNALGCFRFYRTSAKTGYNIKESFESLINQMIILFHFYLNKL